MALSNIAECMRLHSYNEHLKAWYIWSLIVCAPTCTPSHTLLNYNIVDWFRITKCIHGLYSAIIGMHNVETRWTPQSIGKLRKVCSKCIHRLHCILQYSNCNYYSIHVVLKWRPSVRLISLYSFLPSVFDICTPTYGQYNNGMFARWTPPRNMGYKKLFQVR